MKQAPVGQGMYREQYDHTAPIRQPALSLKFSPGSSHLLSSSPGVHILSPSATHLAPTGSVNPPAMQKAGGEPNSGPAAGLPLAPPRTNAAPSRYVRSDSHVLHKHL